MADLARITATAHLHRQQAMPTIITNLRKHMPTMERRLSDIHIGAARPGPSELQPMLQALLATLASIDFEHASDVEIVRNSSVDEWLKQTTISKLHERHHVRRTPYVRRLKGLQKQVQAMAA
jgi:hypothetical protein